MKEKLNVILLAAVEIVIGILLLINPVGFTQTIILVFGIVMIITGLMKVIKYFRTPVEQAVFQQNLVAGLICAVFGLFCALKSGWFIAVFPLLTVLYGIATLISGLTKLQWTVDMFRLKRSHWSWMALSAVLTVIFALVILMNPFKTTAILWGFVGISLMLEAAADIIVVAVAHKIIK